jgi:uncharacterized protein (TIGR02099 family)
MPGIETVVLSEPHALPGDSPLRMPVVDKTVVMRAAEHPPRTASFERLAGKLRLRHEDGGWAFRIAELAAVPGGARRGQALAAPGDVGGFLRGDLRTTFAVRVDARNLRLGELWPLAIAFAPRSADRWLGFAPGGEVHGLSLEASRPRAGAIPRFRVSADVENLSVRPSGRSPGIQRLTAALSGTDERGRIALRSQHAALLWPRMFAEPLLAERLRGDFDWVRDDREWRLTGHDLELERPGLAAHGGLELRFVSTALAPHLVVDAQVVSGDVRLVPAFLPIGRLKERTLAWLGRAFVAGHATGHLSYRGPVKKLPFKYGEGDLVATAAVRDATLDYYPGFEPLTDASGVVRFHNLGVEGELSSGTVRGLAVRGARVRIEDLKNATIEVDAAAAGDVSEALAYLKGSPLAPNLGATFAQLSASGPAAYSIALSLPVRDPESRDYRVATHFERVTLSLPGLRAPVVDLEGTLDLHNLDASAADLRGTFLDGPFTASVSPDVPSASGPAVNVRASGRVSGPRLPEFIGLPAGIGMQGTTPWSMTLRAERQARGEPWTTRLVVASSLAGLAIDAPKPFAKDASETRDSQVRLVLGASARNDIQIDSGRARAQLSFLERDGRWQLDRGLARFDGGPMPKTSRSGLQVVGEWPEFDLGEWLALGGGIAGRGTLRDWLGRVDVHLESARVFGYELRDVDAQLTDDGDDWLVDLACPLVQGRVSVPLDPRANRPIVLDLRRLYLQSAARTAGGPADGRAPVDPRKLQALAITIDDFAWEGRRFGRLVADVRRSPDGLELASLRTQAPAFTLAGTGSWLTAETGTRSALDLEFDSTDLAGAADALGYRRSIEAERAHARASLQWSGGPAGDVLGRLDGSVHLDLGRGRLLNVEPGAAGRVLGLMSVVELPRRLSLDFRDVTDEGLAFDSVRGDFALRAGNAYTDNLLLKGAAVDIGIAGRTGLATHDYDQTVVVSGNPSGPLTVAGALAAGPVVGAGVLVLSQLFKGQLQGLTRAYYRIRGPWSAPDVQRVSAAASEGLAAQETAGSPGAPR